MHEPSSGEQREPMCKRIGHPVSTWSHKAKACQKQPHTRRRQQAQLQEQRSGEE